MFQNYFLLVLFRYNCHTEAHTVECVQHNDLTYIQHEMVITRSLMNIISYRYKILKIENKVLFCDENSGFTLTTFIYSIQQC